MSVNLKNKNRHSRNGYTKHRTAKPYWMGYTVDEDWRTITGLYAVYMEDERIIWETDIAALFEDGTATQNLPYSPKEPVAPATPKLRTSKEKREANNK